MVGFGGFEGGGLAYNFGFVFQFLRVLLGGFNDSSSCGSLLCLGAAGGGV